MEIPQSVIPFINIGLVVWILLSIFLGYKRGFLWEAVRTLGYLFAAILAWIISPGLSDTINIFPRSLAPFKDTNVGELVYSRINHIAWFIILFLVVIILFAFLKPLLKAMRDVPFLKDVNSFLGAVFSLTTTFIGILVIIYVMNSALIKNGKDIIDNTWLRYVKSGSDKVLSLVSDSFSENVAIQKLLSDPLSLTDEDMKEIVQWFKDSQLSSDEIVDFLEKYGIDPDTINDLLNNE